MHKSCDICRFVSALPPADNLDSKAALSDPKELCVLAGCASSCTFRHGADLSSSCLKESFAASLQVWLNNGKKAFGCNTVNLKAVHDSVAGLPLLSLCCQSRSIASSSWPCHHGCRQSLDVQFQQAFTGQGQLQHLLRFVQQYSSIKVLLAFPAS